jgi:hypothetical protein
VVYKCDGQGGEIKKVGAEARAQSVHIQPISGNPLKHKHCMNTIFVELKIYLFQGAFILVVLGLLSSASVFILEISRLGLSPCEFNPPLQKKLAQEPDHYI